MFAFYKMYGISVPGEELSVCHKKLCSMRL